MLGDCGPDEPQTEALRKSRAKTFHREGHFPSDNLALETIPTQELTWVPLAMLGSPHLPGWELVTDLPYPGVGCQFHH